MSVKLVMATETYDGPPSPVVAERERLERAERAMDRFCADLDDLCEHRLKSEEDMDPLTARIYAAAEAAGVDHGGTEDPERAAGWLSTAQRALASLAEDLPAATKTRIWKEWKTIKMRDPDARRCLERATVFFDATQPDSRTRLCLASCLLDYAFVEKRTAPAALTKALRTPPSVGADQRDELESHMMLGRTVRWGGTVLCGIGVVMTGALWLVPVMFVAWLASWALIDRKALERAKALEDGRQQIKKLWGSAPDTGTRFDSDETRPRDTTDVRGVFTGYDETKDR